MRVVLRVPVALAALADGKDVSQSRVRVRVGCVPNITDDPTAWASLIADLFFTLERHIESNGHVSVSFPCKRRSAQTQ